MEYDFRKLEANWKKYWNDNHVYRVHNDTSKPKCYVLDMFPYPSGAGLHVGHPLGYIASDIYARYKRQKGFNVLHPMGFDAFGLPAEQYAIETGQHPAVTTKNNIARYREQLDKIGFSFDWERAVTTADPKYYKWTQWIFLRLFHSWFNRHEGTAQPIEQLNIIFEKEGNINHTCPEDESILFDAKDWAGFSETEKRAHLMRYRLAYQGYAQVWWCEALGTVLANDEVVNGVSERGGYPVERKNMRQWFLRITEYAERLLSSLDTLDWSEAMKEMQRNWIGKSIGAEVTFTVSSATPIMSKRHVTVFTTRPDTIFGVDFMVMAPEHELLDDLVTDAQRDAVEEYKNYVKSRSERERMSEVKQVTGCFTGAYVIHPLTNKIIPVWISEYVLAGYGTGAIMAVPSGDDRDHAFAKHFDLPITNIFGDKYTGEKAYSEKSAIIQNSGFLSGKGIPEAAEEAVNTLVKLNVGHRKVNYKLRDAGFSRQRYWGEPFPIVYVNDVPYATDEAPIRGTNADQLPVELPFVETYKPGPEGQGPLANIDSWMNTPQGTRETNTMPGYAGSSWYFLRYMDPHNDNEFADRAATDYWNQVDLYVGGTEHAVGHLLYSRMWTKALYDLGYIGFDEPFRRLLNQGMIQGSTRFVYRVNGTNQFVSAGLKKDYDTSAIRVNVAFVDGLELDTKAFKQWRPEYADATFILENGKYICGSEVEKMSKSKYNVVNPDDIIDQYGADTFRMYEMFLGPIDVSKPWDTKGIEGVHRFLKKLWRLYNDEQKGFIVTDEPATDAELRILHKTIRKIGDDIERFSFNTAVSQFMICVNELSSLNCHKRAILQPLVALICPFAPHIAEELWHQLGHTGTVIAAPFPAYEERYTVENSKLYPVAVNGKTRVEKEFPLDIEQAQIEKEILADETIQKWLEGKSPKKIIYVKGKMINVVV